MKKSILFCIALLLMLTACGNTNTNLINPASTNTVAATSEETDSIASSQESKPDSQALAEALEQTDENMENQEAMKLKLTIGERAFAVTLADNEAARTFWNELPVTLTMDELHGNEKYKYLSTSYPTDATTPGTIHAGDLMLFGDNCLVLFYETFSSGYSYTSLGNMEDASGLADAVGSGSVVVTLEASE